MTNESKINMDGWDALTASERGQRIIEGLSLEAETLKAEHDAARKALAAIRGAIFNAGVHHTKPEDTLIAILEITDVEICDRYGQVLGLG